MGDVRNTVLFVDDEVQILSAIRRAVIDEPFDAIFAGSAKEALQMIEEKPVSVIVTDMRMPVMDGLKLLKIVRESHPKIVRIVLSGYTQLSQLLATVNQGEIFQFIAKPWQTGEELLGAVRQAIERYNLEAERDSLQKGLALKNQTYLRIFREMEQKLINEKKDLASIKHVNHWLFAFWKKNLEMCAENKSGEMETMIGQVALIEEIHLMYMDTLPTVFEGKDLNQAISSIINACDGRVEIHRQQSETPILFGYYGFLTMVFKLLVYLQASDSDAAVSFDMSVEPKETGSCFVIFDSAFSPESQIDQTRLKIGYSMLNEIGRAYRLRLLPQIGNNRIESVRVIWQATFNNSEEKAD